MTNKHTDTTAGTLQTQNTIKDFNIPAPDIHYTLHNHFRGLKSIRRKYHLTINEIRFLNGMYLYCKHISTCISQDACLRFISYYLNKVKYYINSLLDKNMIYAAEVIKGFNRYKLTQAGFAVIDDINGSFERCLYAWTNKYGIKL